MRVKICGVTRPEDAIVAEEAGADYVGVILVPGSPRQLRPEEARPIAESISLPLAIVTADLEVAELVRAATVAGARVLQLHGNESATLLKELRDAGEWEVWKAVRVRGEEDVATAIDRFGETADLLLFDGWDPRALGGTGTRFPWDALDRLRASIPAGVRLGAAGGLSPENVAEAVALLLPDLVDVSSGVESTPGIKDPRRVRDFVRIARAALDARTGAVPSQPTDS